MRQDCDVKYYHRQKEGDHHEDYYGWTGLGKKCFSCYCLQPGGKDFTEEKATPNPGVRLFSQLDPCLIGMEGCASAHYWARQLEKPGHTVHLIPAEHVKAFLQGNKNGYNDALAIAEAVVRPRMRFIPVETEVQQDMQSLHRFRESQIEVLLRLAHYCWCSTCERISPIGLGT